MQGSWWEQQCPPKVLDQCFKLKQYYGILVMRTGLQEQRVLWLSVSAVLSLSQQSRLKERGLDYYFSKKTSSYSSCTNGRMVVSVKASFNSNPVNQLINCDSISYYLYGVAFQMSAG